MTTTRVKLLAVATLLSLFVGACGGTGGQASSSQAKLDKLVVSYSEVYEGALPLWVTFEAGLFRKHNLDVNLQSIASSTGIAALISGQTQIAQGGGSEVLSANSEGGDIVVVANMVPVYPYVFEANSSIHTVSELRGKKVGISSPGSQSDIATRVGLSKEGLDPNKDVSIIAVGSSQNRTAALKSGAIQGGLDQLPYSLLLERAGFVPLFDLAKLKLPTVNNGVSVKRSYLKDHHDVVQRYVDALVEGLKRMRQDKAFAIGVLKKYLKLNDDQALNTTYDYAKQNLFPALPYVAAEQFADSVGQLSQKNAKVKTVDLNAMIDNSFVKSAAARHLDR